MRGSRSFHRQVEGFRAMATAPDTMSPLVQVGPGGNYLTHDHTLRHMRGEFFMPQVADRMRMDSWRASGSSDARERANQIASEILAAPETRHVPPTVEAAIHQALGDGLVPLDEVDA